MESKKRKLSTNFIEDERNSKSSKSGDDLSRKITSKSSYFINSTSDINDLVSALNYLLEHFPSDIFPELPKQVFVHQIYSLIKNKTQVDRDIESLRKENKIVMFKCDSKSFDENDVVICYYSDFKQYIEKIFTSSSSSQSTIQKSLLSLFTDKILVEQNFLSIQKSVLISKYKLSDRDFTHLIQFGLFNIKDASNFWFAIPNFGSFRKMVLETRKLVLDCIRKKKYKEIEYEELDKRNSKGKVSRMGLVYIMHDLIGNDLISLMDDVPNKSVYFKLKN